MTLAKAVKRAVLYATAQDTVSAWVNGEQVLTAEPLPAWKHLPWKKFVRAEISGELSVGANAIAIEQVHYFEKGYGAAKDDAPPMEATLFVEYADGTTATFSSGTDWKTTAHFKKGKGATGWHGKSFDDGGWKNAVAWAQKLGPDDDPLGHPWIPDSVKSLRRSFTVEKPVKSARLYATSLGSYEIFLNGKRVGDDVLAPGWTDYRQHVKYQTYDVTAQLAGGGNAIAALLAPGWYSTPLQGEQQPNNYGDTPPALRAQLRIEHVDGSVEWVSTDESWKANTSYIQHADIYDGESQDARLIQPGWDRAEFDAGTWKSAIAIDPKPLKIEAQNFAPIRVERSWRLNRLRRRSRAFMFMTLGRIFPGWSGCGLRGRREPMCGCGFAEVLNADGSIYTDNLRTAKATDHFVLGGKGVEEFTPQFTFHGFRYAELTGLPTAPGKDAVTAVVFHTDAAFTDKLDTGSAMINKLWSNILVGAEVELCGCADGLSAAR